MRSGHGHRKPTGGSGRRSGGTTDGYAATIPLEEALRTESFLADRLDGQSLGEHGAPLRLLFPQLYRYKSVKHVSQIEVTVSPLRPSTGRLLGHPRGRVDLEELSGVGAQRLFHWLYRLLLPVFLWRARSVSALREPTD